MTQRKRNLYLSVMVVGLLALAIDRFIFSEASPSAVSADMVGISMVPRAADGVVPPDRQPDLLPQVPFPSAVSRWSSNVSIRDIFSPPESLLVGKAVDRKDGSAGEESRLGVRDFKTKHTLRAIADYGALKIAVTMAGKWVREKDVVDGCTIGSVSGTTVRFSCFDGEDVLSLSP